jgi:hypothetical protein
VTELVATDPESISQRLKDWLDRPLSPVWCLVGWVIATIAFFAIVASSGGPASGDVAESMYSAWAIAHGHPACMYAQNTAVGSPQIPPLYPLISGGIAALTRIGHGVPFPSRLGVDCHGAFGLIGRWSIRSQALIPTLKIGYISWFVLLAGTVAALRASGRGRCGWEPMTVTLLAISPPVWACLKSFFHPQDLMAMGLCLGAVAAARTNRWIWAGILIGLAVLAQQWALLVAGPLFVVCTERQRWRYSMSALGVFALISGFVLIATSGQGLRPIFIGSGNTVGFGGTVLWELHLHGASLVAVSRILPLLIAMSVALWAVRRLGSSAMERVPLHSLLAGSLGLRLVFEQNLQREYYFMALTVALLLLDVVAGRLRGTTIAWIALVALVYNEISWWSTDMPLILFAIAVAVMLVGALRGIAYWYLLAWIAIVGVTLVTWPGVTSVFPQHLPKWTWQVVVITTGMFLALGPLASEIRRRRLTSAPLPIR